MSTLFELFVHHPRMFLALLSVKLFNDAINQGLVDTLAETIDIAVRGLNGARPIATLFDKPAINISDIISILNSTNIEVATCAKIFDQPTLSASKVATIFNDVNLSVSRILSILQDTNLSADRAQAILYAMSDGEYFDRLMQIITSGASNLSVTSSTTLTGVNRYGTLSISSGVTLTLGASPCVLIADTITNSGTITTNVVKGAGGAPGASGAGAGGNGRHGIIILARSISVGTVTANGFAGGNGGTVGASASGGAGGAGLLWEISGYPAGTGGSGGNGTYAGPGSKNGGGGGGTGAGSIPGGSGGTASVTTFATAKDLLKELFKPVIDWWLVNVLGKTPTTTKTIPALGGSGGGGGSARDTYGAAGGGGGGGGQIIIYGTSVTAGTVQAKAGNGGNGGTEGAIDGGGGGGGGGIIYVFYKTLSGTFSFDVSGGAAGTGDRVGTAGTAGSAAAFAV